MDEERNSVSLIGRVTRDAELRYTNNGSALCEVGLAVSTGKEYTSFFDLTLWKALAEENVSRLRKGTMIKVKGFLKQDRWEKAGQTYSKVKVSVLQLDIMEEQRDERDPRTVAPQASPVVVEDKYEDDIPF